MKVSLEDVNRYWRYFIIPGKITIGLNNHHLIHFSTKLYF